MLLLMVMKKKTKSAKASVEQKKPETEAAPKDEVPVTLLNIQVGLIRKAWKHPSADRCVKRICIIYLTLF